MTILNEINDQLSNEIDDLNAFLKKVTTTEIPLINTLSSHMIDSGGKRIRPIIVFLISKIFILICSFSFGVCTRDANFFSKKPSLVVF